MTSTQEQQEESQVARQLKYCKRLPTLPTVALQLVELADDSSATLEQFAAIIAFDPALVGKLLRTANSSFYGHRRKISSLSEAVGLLGLNATIALSLSFSLCGLSSGHAGGGLADTDYWHRSLLTALAARVIALELREVQPEDFLLAGLLQGIGVLAMHSMLGTAYAELYKESSCNHVTLLSREASRYGFDHAQAGAELLKIWRLPERIYQSVWHSHAITQQATDSGDISIKRLSVCVAAAASIANAWVLGASAEAFNTAHEVTHRLLGISPEQYQVIITSMSEEIPDMEALFETQLIDPKILQGVEDSARELLAIRNLSQSRSSTEATMQVQVMEQRIATLEVQTQRDPMTGLYNRAYFERKFELEFARALREGSPLSLALIDIDQFKAVNDTFGHAVGDQVLITVANRLLSATRQTDTVARYGGEEFVVLLTDTGPNDARLPLERMLVAVRDTPCLIRDGARSITVTFSTGLAALTPGGTVFATPAALLEAADQILYKVKQTERGRIGVHEPTVD